MATMKGFLLKRGTQDHKRWFSLSGYSLSWLTAEGGEVLGVLDVRGAKFMSHPQMPLTFKIEGGEPLVLKKAGKDYIMTAESEEDFQRWKDSIEPATQIKKEDGSASWNMEGFLMKQGSKGLLGGHSSERRWFELRGHKLNYYENQGGSMSGSLDLREAHVKCSADSLTFVLEGPILNVQKKGKAYELTAETFEDMRSWTGALKRACESSVV
eukprot:TRINITY_DN23197_c0_g1_i1.p1 TRINITY_DN23197_c0_g1~~TRINITY_DN23197_c0_g1_i1.p1  ORF type:complete len:212 (+),score=59.68 TRINITY_DN23197_c0_g1_i1:113-748(+)